MKDRKGKKRRKEAVCVHVGAYPSWVQPLQSDEHRGILGPINRFVKTEIEQL